MKRFLVEAVRFKTSTCMAFTASVIIYSLIALLYGDSTVTIATLGQLLFASALCTLLQGIFFSDLFIKKMRYSLRLLCSLPAYFAAILGCALLFHWFPLGNWRAWLLFAAIFIVLFTDIVAGFEIYFRFTGRKYDDLLQRYREENP